MFFKTQFQGVCRGEVFKNTVSGYQELRLEGGLGRDVPALCEVGRASGPDGVTTPPGCLHLFSVSNLYPPHQVLTCASVYMFEPVITGASAPPGFHQH